MKGNFNELYISWNLHAISCKIPVCAYRVDTSIFVFSTYS